MARLDPRFNALDSSTNNTFSEALFDKTNKSMMSATVSKPLTDLKNKSMSNCVDTENTKKFQVSFNMGSTNNFSLLEQYRNRDGNNERTDNTDAKMLTECEETEQKPQSYHANNTLQPAHQLQQQTTTVNVQQTKRTDINTPQYTKNPNMTNNKIGEIIEASIDDKKNTPIAFATNTSDPLIEPSPSGITRCYVKFDEAEMLRSKVPYIPSNDAVQVNYLNPSQRPITQKVDSSTSPFVVLKTSQSKIQDNITELQQYERNKVNFMQKTQSTEAYPKSTESYVTASKYGTETKLVNKLDGKKVDSLKRLEKSKVIFVNLTPKPCHPSSNVEQTQQQKFYRPTEENFQMVNKAFLNNETKNQTDMNIGMKDSAVSYRTQRTMYDEDPTFDESFIRPNKTIETPVSAKFYSKPQSDRLKAIREERSDEAVNMSEANPLLYKRNLSYYDNVMNKNETELNDDNEDDEHTYNPSMRNNTQMNNTTQNDYQYQQYKYQQVAPQMVENVQHVSQNSCEDYDNMKPRQKQKTGSLKRYNLSTIDEDAEANQLKEEQEHQEKYIKTYYDGKKCWTNLASSKSEYDNHNSRLNEGYESSQDSLKRQANEDDVDGNRHKSETRVKIQLPEETFEKMEAEERKPRKCQSFCFNFFVFLIFLLVVAILAYFIGFDSFAREKLFDVQYWKNVFSIKD